jgi:hypothetical protein
MVLVMLGTGVLGAAAPSLRGAPALTAPGPTRASVVLVDDFNEWLPAAIVERRSRELPPPRAIVIRRANVEPPNVILVTRATGPDDLTKAIGVLALSLEHKPEAQWEMRAYINPARANPSAVKSRPQAVKDIARLARAREYDIAGVGRRKAIAIRIRKPDRKPR